MSRVKFLLDENSLGLAEAVDRHNLSSDIRIDLIAVGDDDSIPRMAGDDGIVAGPWESLSNLPIFTSFIQRVSLQGRRPTEELDSGRTIEEIPMNLRGLLVAISLVGLAWPSSADDPRPEMEEGLREAITATDWVYDVESVRLRATITTTRPEETVARKQEEFIREHGGTVPEEKLRDVFTLQPTSVANLQLAWDRTRAAYRFDAKDWLHEAEVWDGNQSIAESRWPFYDQHEYKISSVPPNTIRGSFFRWLPWSLTNDHLTPLQVAAIDRQAMQMARDANRDLRRQHAMQLHSHVDFEGVQCALYGAPQTGVWDRFYVDTNSGRLRGMNVGSWGLTLREARFPMLRQLLSGYGVDVANPEEADAAVSGLPEQDRQQLKNKVASHLEKIWWGHLPQIDPLWTILLEDWRELLPSREYPFRQVMTSYRKVDGELTLDETRVITIDRLEINGRLDEELFRLSIEEGADVYDTTRDPPLRYKQDSNRTAEEWAAIIAGARARSDSEQAEQQRLDELVGTPAPALSGEAWLHSEPMNWEQLRGRYVILEFWHIGCGPCWSELGLMQALHARRDQELGVSVIAIHGSGADAEQIEQALRERFKSEVSFPICVDRSLAAGEQAETFTSEIFSRYRVRRMPFAWLVGPDGTLIEHGDGNTLLDTARSLMRIDPDR